MNTPGTRGWSRLRDRTLAVAKMTFISGRRKNYLKKIFFLHISSSYAKILGETNFHAREIPRSGRKVEGGEEKEKRKKKKKKVGENNGQLRFVRHHVWRTQARLDQNLYLVHSSFTQIDSWASCSSHLVFFVDLLKSMFTIFGTLTYCTTLSSLSQGPPSFSAISLISCLSLCTLIFTGLKLTQSFKIKKINQSFLGVKGLSTTPKRH